MHHIAIYRAYTVLAWGYQCGNLEKNKKTSSYDNTDPPFKQQELLKSADLVTKLNFTTNFLTCYCWNISLILTSQTKELTIHKTPGKENRSSREDKS